MKKNINAISIGILAGFVLGVGAMYGCSSTSTISETDSAQTVEASEGNSWDNVEYPEYGYRTVIVGDPQTDGGDYQNKIQERVNKLVADGWRLVDMTYRDYLRVSGNYGSDGHWGVVMIFERWPEE